MKHIDWIKFKQIAEAQLGKPYRFGHEVKLDDPNPIAFDCSEYVQWCFHQIGVTVPDGSFNQYQASTPVTNTQIGDVGFFEREPELSTDPPGIYHVGMILDDKNVIESRGEPFNQVILRPREKWEQFVRFNGWRRFTAVTK